MYLDQDLNRRLSTIDDYRTAIVDFFVPGVLRISKSSDLDRVLSNFHRDRPKSPELTEMEPLHCTECAHKASFEPMKDINLNNLKKTAFLSSFVLQQVPRRNSCLGCKQSVRFRPMGKGSFFPSSDFIAKNQLAREGSQTVSQVIIPALITIVD